jgi:hypothetical protein
MVVAAVVVGGVLAPSSQIVYLRWQLFPSDHLQSRSPSVSLITLTPAAALACADGTRFIPFHVLLSVMPPPEICWLQHVTDNTHTGTHTHTHTHTAKPQGIKAWRRRRVAYRDDGTPQRIANSSTLQLTQARAYTVA